MSSEMHLDWGQHVDRVYMVRDVVEVLNYPKNLRTNKFINSIERGKIFLLQLITDDCNEDWYDAVHALRLSLMRKQNLWDIESQEEIRVLLSTYVDTLDKLLKYGMPSVRLMPDELRSFFVELGYIYHHKAIAGLTHFLELHSEEL